MKKTVLITGACINTGVAIVEKFALEGWNVVFTGRNPEKVALAEKNYRDKFPNVEINGYAMNSLVDERTVNERALDELFADLDKKDVFIECLVLNAADQGLNMKIFENPVTDFMRVLNTNITWNFCIVERAAKRMKENGWTVPSPFGILECLLKFIPVLNIASMILDLELIFAMTEKKKAEGPITVKIGPVTFKYS